MAIRVSTDVPVRLSRKSANELWQAFLKHGTIHSENGSTLPYIIDACEREGMGYVLTHLHRGGYFIKPLDAPD